MNVDQRGKIAAEQPAPGEVERLERGEASQRGQVAAESRAIAYFERLERDEACKRGEVAELRASFEVELLERSEAFQPGGSRVNVSSSVTFLSFHPLRSNSTSPVSSAFRIRRRASA
jgi:hypothetical protein